MKLIASFLNTLSLAILGAALIVPGVTSLENVRWIWIPAAFALHLGAHAAVFLLRSEE